MSSTLRYLYRAVRYRYWVDPAELRFVRSRLRPGQLAVDVGCHKGAYTYWMRKWVGRRGEVVAFEPQPRQAEYLRFMLNSMRYENVTLAPLGLSDAPGRLRLHVPAARGATHEASFVAAKWGERACHSHEVEVTTLDAYFAARSRLPNFLKIDVEGMELAVLRGGLKTLTTAKPSIVMECEARHRPDGDVRPVFDFLETLGYKGSFFHRGSQRPLSEFRPQQHQPEFAPREKPPRGYVNNFAFVHSSQLP